MRNVPFDYDCILVQQTGPLVLAALVYNQNVILSDPNCHLVTPFVGIRVPSYNSSPARTWWLLLAKLNFWAVGNMVDMASPLELLSHAKPASPSHCYYMHEHRSPGPALIDYLWSPFAHLLIPETGVIFLRCYLWEVVHSGGKFRILLICNTSLFLEKQSLP